MVSQHRSPDLDSAELLWQLSVVEPGSTAPRLD